MKYLFLFARGIFDSDPVTTGGVGGSTKPLAADGLCTDPGAGRPKYVTAVLNALLGCGTINRADYKAVVAGTKSIEDLGITPAELARLRCDGTGDAQVYDPHFDSARHPAIGITLAGLTAQFMTGHKPTDKVHRISVTAGGQSVPAGSLTAHVTFNTPYQDDDGQLVAPNVMVSGAGGTATWRAINVTPQGYDLACDSGIGSDTVAGCQVVVEPARL